MPGELNSIFDEREFWWKLGVDYDGATSKEGEDKADYLLSKFESRKKNIIKDEMDSMEKFRKAAKFDDNAENLLLRIYVRKLWSNKGEGTEFKSENARNMIEQAANEKDLIREVVDDEFEVLWPSEDVIDTQVSGEEVTGHKYKGAKPVLIKKAEEGFEVRGRSRDTSSVESELGSEENVERIEPERKSEAIATEIRKVLTESNGFFKIRGMEFSESELPQNSSLSIKNDDDIYQDAKTLQNDGLISLEGMSEISKLYLVDIETGSKYRINVKHRDEGFLFELVAQNKLDSERIRFRRDFESVTDIELQTEYEYSSQADERYLVNRILAESSDAYEKYYDKLSEESQSLVDELVETREEVKKICQNCGTVNEPENDECEDCGEDEFFEPRDKLIVEVDEAKVFSKVREELGDIEPEHPKIEAQSWDTEYDYFGSNDSKRRYLRGSFHNLDMADSSSTSNYEEVYILQKGNMRKPRRLDDYLLKSILVTYGNSYSDELKGYGVLDLYELLMGDEPTESLLGDAVHDALLGVDERLFDKARKSKQDGDELVQKMEEIRDSGDDLSNHKEELQEFCRRNKFEKHVFYLMKSVFPYSERMGKEGKRDYDGALICPTNDGSEFYVATNDSKLSYDDDGYNLDSGEVDKAVRYVRNASEDERILNKTDEEGPSAHIFISQNFREHQFERVENQISEEVEGRNIDVIFMDFESLLELYYIHKKYRRQLQDHRVRERFHKYIVQELKKSEVDEDYLHFNEESVENIKSKLLDTIDNFDDEPVRRYSD